MDITSINVLLEVLQEALPVNKVFIAENKRDRRLEEIVRLCRAHKVVFQVVPPQVLERKAGLDHQGVFAEVSPIRFYELEEVLQDIKTGLILILDGVEDTGNLGAIIRSAVAADVDAILLPQRHSAPINETVLKTSAGTLLRARIVQCGNLSQTLEVLKKNNFWVVGTVMDTEKAIPYHKFDYRVNTAIIMGNEHKGTSLLLQKNSDQLVYIPHSAKAESLNVSAATAVMLFEALRQKKG